MTWLAIRLFLGGAASKLWTFLKSLSFWQLVSMGLAIFVAVQHFQLADARHDRDAWHKQFDAEHKARKADRDSYHKAQADAKVLNAAQVAAAVVKQEKINHAQVSNLNARLELIRRELRKPAAQGSPGSAQTGPGVESPCRALDPAWLCVSPEERLRAAENEERHDELIDLVIQQSAVDPNH